QGLRWTERILSRPRDVSPALWASVLVTAGQLAPTKSRDDPKAELWLGGAILTVRPMGRKRALASALFWPARGVLFSDRRRSKDRLDEALLAFRAREDWLGIAFTLYLLRMIAYEDGNDELWRALAVEMREVAAERAPAALGMALMYDAFDALESGDTA